MALSHNSRAFPHHARTSSRGVLPALRSNVHQRVIRSTCSGRVATHSSCHDQATAVTPMWTLVLALPRHSSFMSIGRDWTVDGNTESPLTFSLATDDYHSESAAFRRRQPSESNQPYFWYGHGDRTVSVADSGRWHRYSVRIYPSPCEHGLPLARTSWREDHRRRLVAVAVQCTLFFG